MHNCDHVWKRVDTSQFDDNGGKIGIPPQEKCEKCGWHRALDSEKDAKKPKMK